jgi:hypothetical protein
MTRKEKDGDTDLPNQNPCPSQAVVGIARDRLKDSPVSRVLEQAFSGGGMQNVAGFCSESDVSHLT